MHDASQDQERDPAPCPVHAQEKLGDMWCQEQGWARKASRTRRHIAVETQEVGTF